MESTTMGKVLVTAKIENLDDLFQVARGQLSADQVRTVEIGDALVDTGATLLSLPKRFIEQLGLIRFQTRRVRTAGGAIEAGVFGTVRLSIQGREFTTDAVEVDDDCPVLIGQIPLEGLDFVVDLKQQKLVGNPEHGGEHVVEIY